MNRKRASACPRSGCPISISLDLFGDSWTLLVIRDLLFKGFSRFSEFLNAGEGIASNILTERLHRLEAHGLITRHPDPDDARRQRYRLTEKGLDLAPVLIEMVLWAARHEQTEAPPEIVEAMQNQRETVLGQLRTAWQARSPDD